MSGSAAIISRDCIRLTADRPYQSGSAWFKTAFDLRRPFEMKLSIVLGKKDLDGADGIVFVFHPTIQTGARGEGMGFAGLIPSLGIEFDTYQNLHLNEPASDHMAFMRNGQTFHFDGRDGVVELKNLEDGARHPLRIAWRPKVGQLQVYLDNRLIASYPAVIVKGIFGGQNRLYWGMTAATGRLSNVQDVCIDGILLEV